LEAEARADDARRLEQDCINKFNEAERLLNEVLAKGGDGGKGSVWFLERDLAEVRKYLPKSKQNK